MGSEPTHFRERRRVDFRERKESKRRCLRETHTLIGSRSLSKRTSLSGEMTGVLANSAFISPSSSCLLTLLHETVTLQINFLPLMSKSTCQAWQQFGYGSKSIQWVGLGRVSRI
ncbi:hypothetical protein AMTR_s00213p00023920 [Amborella trichopoda]|uniref:Uncharacterized protein n=1 Tax=Amborella trichopoda TaxID=13333 RepID=W1P491_AMBTC|nr:hypothetical protein AMTR_s00213p00023920 [Amborella trichopoda]